MSYELQEALRSAALAALVPLADLMLDARLGSADLEAISREAMVTAAVRRGAAVARRENISRIAEETGLARKTVGAIIERQRGAPGKPSPVKEGRPRAEKVLEGWSSDPEFTTANGAPAVLTKEQLYAVARRYSGDPHNVAAVIEVMLRSGAVRAEKTDRFRLMRLTCATVSWDLKAIQEWSIALRRVSETRSHNLRNPSRPRFSRTVEARNISEVMLRRVLLPELEEAATLFLDNAHLSLEHTSRGAQAEQSPKVCCCVTVELHEEPSADVDLPALAHSARGRKNTRRRSRS